MKSKTFYQIAFSQYDKKINVKIPKLNNKLLAYEIGVHLGDGSMQIVPKKTHSVRYWGDSNEDWLFVSEVLPKIIKELYNKNVIARKCNDSNKCVLSVCSKAIATFKRDIIGLPAGNKKQIKGLPKFVKKNRNLLINCLRGIGDTDFGLYFHRDGTPGLACIMSNKDLIEDIGQEIRNLGIDAKIKFDIIRMRKGKQNIEHHVKIYCKKNLEKWMKIISFENPKHLTKYLCWKHLNFSKNRTTVKQRTIMLEEAGIFPTS